MRRPFLATLAAMVSVGIFGTYNVATHAAEAFPSSTVTIVVPFPAGGTADFLPRIVADIVSRSWNQPVVIENISGAAGNIGAERVARAKPDGYTLLASAPGPLAINHHLYKSLPYDPTKFTPITVLGTSPNVLVVSPKLTARSAKDLITLAKSNPGKVTYASQGAGSTSHLTASLFESMAGVELVHVPYKGSAPALNDLLGGHVDIMFDNLTSSLAQHRAGKLRILAVADRNRAPALPDIPTIAESGLPNFLSVTWFGVVAPPNTPELLITQINRAIVEALQRPEVRSKFLEQGAEPVGNTSADMARFIAEESARWGQVIKTAKVTLD
jgi:tripartite-type tricarboxylate transporter receptor subunit TctC